MDIHAIRNKMMLGASVYQLDLRVVYYARVSTEKDEQINSLENQISFFEDYVNRVDSWTLVGSYVDEGLSGMSTTKRENFQKMIRDGEFGKFDLIITKEISRFARNTVDSLNFTRSLLANGVGVLFLNDAINTLEPDSELRLTIMSAIAQEELRKLSSRIKFGHSQAIKKGVVLGNSRIYGYNQAGGKLELNEQADMVKQIFELYATGDYTTPMIERMLYEQGHRNTKGEQISRTVISHIITNPKYKGYYCGGKVKITDMFTKKQQFIPEEDWVMYKDETGETVPAIVDEELWELANRIHKERGDKIKNTRTSIKPDNLFTGKIICAKHNVPFWLKSRRIRNKENNTWVCSHRIKNGKDSCPTYGIKESELLEILNEILCELSSDIDTVIHQYVSHIKKVIASTDFGEKIEKVEKEKQKLIKQKDRIFDLLVEDVITKKEFKNQNERLQQQVINCDKELVELRSNKEKTQDYVDEIFKFKKELVRFIDGKQGIIKPSIINLLVEKIMVDTVGVDNHMELTFYLRTGQTARKAVSCSDNTLLTIYPPT